MRRTENAGQKDCAQMWFGPDFRGSLKVQAMDWAQRGMYRELLDLAWENLGIPADLEEIRGILKLTPDEFAAAWKRIGRCFVPHPEDPARLINERQEKERAIRASIKQKRADAGRLGNEIRHGARASDSQGDRKGDAGTVANGSQNTRLSPSPPPSPSPGVPLSPAGSSESVPSCGTGEPQQDGRSARGAAGRSGTRKRLLLALRASSYRRNSQNRDADLDDAVDRLDAVAIDEDDLQKLAARAERKGDKPKSLFAHWVDHPDEAVKELGKR